MTLIIISRVKCGTMPCGSPEGSREIALMVGWRQLSWWLLFLSSRVMPPLGSLGDCDCPDTHTSTFPPQSPPPGFSLFPSCSVGPCRNNPGNYLACVETPLGSLCKNRLLRHSIFRLFTVYKSYSYSLFQWAGDGAWYSNALYTTSISELRHTWA